MKPLGYIKLHRSILDSRLFSRDKDAMYLFITILLLVDRGTGSYTGGRFRLAALCGIKPMTCYRKLKRLESEMMLKLEPNRDFTKITVVNWKLYQSSETQSERKANAKRTQSDTKQEERIKNKKVVNKLTTKENSEITQLIKHFEDRIGKMQFPQRQVFAATDLVKQHGFEKSIGAVNAVVASRSQQYAPSISNLEELRDKWIKLETFYQRTINNKPKGVKIN